MPLSSLRPVATIPASALSWSARPAVAIMIRVATLGRSLAMLHVSVRATSCDNAVCGFAAMLGIEVLHAEEVLCAEPCRGWGSTEGSGVEGRIAM